MNSSPARGARWTLVAWVIVAGCGNEATAPAGPPTVVVTPASWLLTSPGEEVHFEATVRDQDGNLVPTPDVTWEVTGPTVASVQGPGQIVALGPGVAQVVARWAGAQGAADLEVYFPAGPEEFLPGMSYFGRSEYVEYVPGTLPVVISAPHGGSLEPAEIANRTWGVTVADTGTEATIRAIRGAFATAFGAAPHIVISHLRRTKLDPNRELEEAAQGSPHAGLAWREYHGFIERGRGTARERLGWGLYLDLHGHGHPKQRLELGYLLSSSDLAAADSVLSGLQGQSSVVDLAARSSASFPDFIRGDSSLGSLLQGQGVRAVPSGLEPDPEGGPYFSGGYSTVRHGSRNGGTVSGIQLELNWEGIRDSEANRAIFAQRLAAALDVFLSTHGSPAWSGAPGSS